LPSETVREIVRLRTELPELRTLVGVRKAVNPDGEETERVTLPLKPFNGETLMVTLPELPWLMIRTDWLDEIWKSGVGTVSVTRSVFVLVPIVPFTLMRYVPGVAFAGTVIVRVVLFEPADWTNTDVKGLKERIGPGEDEEAVSVTFAAKPFWL